MIATYGIDDQAILKMPLRRFWLLSRNIDRLAAEKDYRAARIACATQSEEAVGELFGALEREMGRIAVMDEVAQQRGVAKQAYRDELDRDGLHSLKDLGNLGKV